MNSFIPKTRPRLAIVDARLGQEALARLEGLGLEVIKTIECRELDRSISYHPDLVLHPIDGKNLVAAPNTASYYRDKLADFGIKIRLGETSLSRKYPGDIAYNVGRIGRHYVHKRGATDPLLRESLEGEGLELVDVKQGYSKCSLAVLGEDLAITSDRPMYEKLKALGYDILLIRPGYIDLPGQNYGFIGGCLGVLDENRILVSGTFNEHPDQGRILEFLRVHKKEIIYLNQGGLLDIGTIIVL